MLFRKPHAWCLAALVVAIAPASSLSAADLQLDSAVDTYEHLATVIIEVRRTEDGVVKSILASHYVAAQADLKAAEQGKDVLKNLEAAAAEISNLANEGDKRVQAIRQRLSKAGHTHISDADTKEDYLFINSKEKKALLEAAKAIVQLGAKATPDKIAAASKNLESLYMKAVAPE